MARKYRVTVNGKAYDVDVEDLGAGSPAAAPVAAPAPVFCTCSGTCGSTSSCIGTGKCGRSRFY